MAYLVSALNPALQAAAYSAISVAIFLALLSEMYRASHSGLAVITISVVTAVFAPFMLFNLTFSFWPGLAMLGLIGLRANYQEKDLSFTDLLLCVPGLTGSPLGLLFFPLFALAAFEKRSWRSGVVAISTGLSYLVLVESDGHRSGETSMLERAIENFIQIASGQLNLLIDTSGPGVLVMGSLGLLSVTVVSVIGLIYLVRFQKERGAVLLYAAGSLATVVAAMGASGMPLAGRYWFPIIICALVLSGSLYMHPHISRFRRIAEPILIFLFLGAFLASSALRIQSWGGASSSAVEWSLMLQPPDDLTALKRSWHADDKWALGLGNVSVHYDDCVGLWEHPSSKEDYGFRVYCGESVF